MTTVLERRQHDANRGEMLDLLNSNTAEFVSMTGSTL